MMSLTLILTLSSLSGYGAKAVRDTISLNLQEVKLEVRGSDETKDRIEFPV